MFFNFLSPVIKMWQLWKFSGWEWHFRRLLYGPEILCDSRCPKNKQLLSRYYVLVECKTTKDTRHLYSAFSFMENLSNDWMYTNQNWCGNTCIIRIPILCCTCTYNFRTMCCLHVRIASMRTAWKSVEFNIIRICTSENRAEK